ncbi:hypothetical protein [Sphingobium cupriresistens]|uniref:Uncharacterized protein n=1 Tax=Sphingobium cupriresistens TaxID=1132417 RepID=A0A8G1ZJG3_9SPHN|nr:hypothetical protein [Sphingobium cupriresistens]RYM14904.1 hypothetical protein EWH12_00365 [Sphingobium cupriresistens]
MLYRNFAIATLLAAPLIVMATQAFLPQPNAPQQDQSAIKPDVPPPPPPVPAAPVATPGAPSVEAATSFGQPMAGADQPALAPGAGLPDTSAPPMTGGMAPGFSPQDAPAGSPNSE